MSKRVMSCGKLGLIEVLQQVYFVIGSITENPRDPLAINKRHAYRLANQVSNVHLTSHIGHLLE
ncbi:MAG: hypothetical protein GX855_08115 [Firmicutes bacterium]|nr:hypothetical protein [Bacillota bacterium]